jgi:hypothetical protein
MDTTAGFTACAPGPARTSVSASFGSSAAGPPEGHDQTVMLILLSRSCPRRTDVIRPLETTLLLAINGSGNSKRLPLTR